MNTSLIVPMLLIGAVGCLLAARMPASGKAALGLGLLPLLGIGLALAFC
jgi:hypothetical protein